jgi:hypothetical protein
MALGVIHIRGNLCKYSNAAPKGKRGKFCKCAGKKRTSRAKNTRRARRRSKSR